MIAIHRWIGVGLCLLFAMWFASGIVMMYVPFPSLAETERLANSPALDLSNVDQSSMGVLDRVQGSIDRIRLIQSPQRPLLIVESAAGETTAYLADSQQPAPLLDASDARHVAEVFSGESAGNVVGPFDFDQWVVHQAFDRYRPYFRIDMEDGSHTSLYVSRVTGEIVQRTTRWQRAWNYVGAVVHWIYPTIIRKHWALWDGLVWWLSLAGIVGALLGTVLGIIRLRDAWRRGRRGLASPFVGWMRWHHQLGLVTGLFVVSWIVSGWLSMDHGRLFSMPDPTAAQVAAFRGIELREAASRITPDDLAQFAGAKALEIAAVGELPAVISRSEADARVLVYDNGLRPRPLGRNDAERAVGAAWPNTNIAASAVVAQDDAYAHLREGSLGEEVLRIVLDDADETWVHVDLQRARIVSVMDGGRRLYRWLFNGLHSLDFPGFVDRRPLWDLSMLALLLGGLAFSSTGVVIAYRRIGQLTGSE